MGCTDLDGRSFDSLLIKPTAPAVGFFHDGTDPRDPKPWINQVEKKRMKTGEERILLQLSCRCGILSC